MKHLFALCLLFVGTTLCACQPSGTTGGSEAARSARVSLASPTAHAETEASQTTHSKVSVAASASPATTDTATRALKQDLKDGMSYAAFRQNVLSSGWRPLQDKQCMANVAGADYQSFCPKNGDLAACTICKELPELSSCSGDGYCLMQFTHAGSSSILQATTYGDFSRWHAHASDGSLMISGWELAPSPAK